MSIKEIVMHNWLVQLFYKGKFYFNVTSGQIGFLSNKIPEFMGYLYISEKMGYEIPSEWIGPMAISLFLLFILIGWFWRYIGLYHAEQYVDVNRNPVQKELLDGARLIKQHFGGKK